MRTNHIRSRRKSVLLLLVIVILEALPVEAQELAVRNIAGSENSFSATRPSPQLGELISVELAIKNWKQVHKGDVLEGHLALPVYSGQQRILPRGATIHLTIESIEKVSEKTGAWKKIGRGIVQAFSPLEKSALPEYNVKLRQADIVSADGQRLVMDAEVLRAGSGVLTEAERRRGKSKANGDTLEQADSGQNKKKKHTSARMLLNVEKAILPKAEKLPGNDQLGPAPEGKARAFLLNGLSASRNHPGDRFQAVLAEPARVDGHDLDAGSLVEGKVVRSTPPRMLSRAGSLHLQVDRVVSSTETIAVTGSLSGIEAGRKTVALDEEGTMRGLKPGLKNALIDLGYAYAIGKVVDDMAETPIRAAGAAMSDAAVANAARYFGLGASVIFLVTRHGRDVQLPKYGEIEIELGRIQTSQSK